MSVNPRGAAGEARRGRGRAAFAALGATPFLLLFAAAACTEEPPTRKSAKSGELSFEWRFDGALCESHPEIQHVRVRIAGERGPIALPNGGLFACADGEGPGRLASLGLLEPGAYRWSAVAEDRQQRALFAAASAVTIDGDVALSIELMPQVAAGALELFWRFWRGVGGQPVGCEGAMALPGKALSGIKLSFSPTLAGEEVPLLPCQGELGEGGALTLTPRTRFARVEALVEREASEERQARSEAWYGAVFHPVLSSNTTRQVSLLLRPIASPVSLRLELADAEGARLSCAEAAARYGLSRVQLVLTRRWGEALELRQEGTCQRFEEGATEPWVPASERFDERAERWSATWTLGAAALGPGGNTLALGAQEVLVVAGLEQVLTAKLQLGEAQ